MSGMHYTYLHKRASDGLPFYVGKGTRRRAWSATGRNQYWTRIAAKHGVDVVIVDAGLSEEEALSREVELIAFLKDLGAELCNMTGGGDGATHYDQLGKKNHMFGRTGERHHLFGKPRSEETKQKLRNANLGKRLSEETRRLVSSNTSRHWLGKKMSAETRAKLSAAMKGRKGPVKSVVCVETGEFHESGFAACDWLKQQGLEKPSSSAITKACRGKLKSAYGYQWRYA